MAIPSFQEIMLPLLQLAGDGQVHLLAETRGKLAKRFGLSAVEEEELLPSGRQGRFTNRVAWAKVYLERSGLLASPRRGQFTITDRGRSLLENPPSIIDIKYLQRYPEFLAFRARPQSSSTTSIAPSESDTPEETLEMAYQAIRGRLATELMERVKASSPRFFERLVVELLLQMGYGRASGGVGEAIGKSGDEGIDGIIAEDRLGLEMVYLQAKRWQGTVGRPEIQRFVGALHGQRARKGVFITTGIFSPEARAYIKNIDPKVALIDGAQLAEFMIDFNVGVAKDRVFEVKKIDSDYFED